MQSGRMPLNNEDLCTCIIKSPYLTHDILALKLVFANSLIGNGAT